MSRTTTMFALILLAACGSDGGGPSDPAGATLELTTSTRGAPPDPDGYLVVVDGGDGTALALNDTLDLSEVAAGEHRIELTGLAENCLLSGPNPRTVVAAAGAVTKVRLDVMCSAMTGTLRIEVTTGGTHPDPDGYLVAVNGSEQPIQPNATLTVADLPPGEVEVRLEGLAANCTAAGDNPRLVGITIGDTASAIFAVECAPTAEGTLLFTSDRRGSVHLYRMREDGSEVSEVAPSQQVFSADWSPDGSRIVFGRAVGDNPELFVMSADGSDVRDLGISGSSPRWSPDGLTIAFTAPLGVALVAPDGSNLRVLSEGYQPDWSPDGTRIVFSRLDRSRCLADIACPVEMFVIGTDGSGLRRVLLASNPSDEMSMPRWSPDGTSIAFGRYCCFLGANLTGLWVVDSEGDRPHRISAEPVLGPAVWSPDAAALAAPFRQSDGTVDVVLLPLGRGVGQVLAGPGSDYPQAWR